MGETYHNIERRVAFWDNFVFNIANGYKKTETETANKWCNNEDVKKIKAVNEKLKEALILSLQEQRDAIDMQVNALYVLK